MDPMFSSVFILSVQYTVQCTVGHAVKLFAQYSAERKAPVSSSHAFTVYIFPFPPREGAHGVAA